MNKKKPKFPMHQNASASIFDRARALRTRETSTEKQLWERLRGKKLAGINLEDSIQLVDTFLIFTAIVKILLLN